MGRKVELGHERTVELMGVMNNRLDNGATTRFLLVQTHFFSLFLVELEYDGKRGKGDSVNDSKSAVTPTPGSVINERLANKRSGEGSANKRGLGEGEGEGTVAQAGRIGDKDVHDKEQRTVTDLEKDVSSRI